jgi:hypothetical protein
MTNHFEGHGEISKKHEMFKNLRSLCDEIGENVFHITPLTFFLKIAPDRAQFSIKEGIKQFKQIYRLLDEFKEIFDCNEGTDSETRLKEYIEAGNVALISKHRS